MVFDSVKKSRFDKVSLSPFSFGGGREKLLFIQPYFNSTRYTTLLLQKLHQTAFSVAFGSEKISAGR